MRARLLLTALLAFAALACSKGYDLADRRSATQDEYALRDQVCGASNEHVVANGVLTNHSGEPNGFAVVVRFFDGDVDLGRPQTVEHPELIADGDTWRWTVELMAPHPPRDLRCNVIQVAIGDDVDL